MNERDAWDGLVSAALLGTQRRRFDPARLPPALRPLVDGEPEAALLSAAAVLANYRRAGQRPARPDTRPPVAERDARPLVPPAARRRLPRLPADLQTEWLDAVRAKGMRVPPEHLPALAEAATSRPGLRAALAAVAGPAGGWLGRHNPAWSFLADAPTPGASTWEYGSPTQRRAWLRRTFATDPAAARATLARTWAEEPAGDRAEFLAVLGEHLRPEDEPALESALDDRAAQVRRRAAALLARLPGSRLAARMAERAGRCVRRDGDTLVVTPPDPTDAALLRDAGAAETGRAALLSAVVAATPLGHWARLGRPRDLVGLPVTGADAGVLRLGWVVAARRQQHAGEVAAAPGVEWAAALLSVADADLAGPALLLVRELPPRAHRPAVAVLAERLLPQATASAVAQLPAPWSPELGGALLDWLAQHPGHRGLGAAARAVGRTVPVGCLRHPVATGALPFGAAPWWRELAATLTVRREMHEELDR